MLPTPPDMDQDPIRTVDDAAAYLEGLINRERSTDYAYRRLDLRPIEALLDALGRPDASLSIIHVAGSKGKGSTCLFAESLLLALGEHVGTFTSPHLVSWVERFRVDGRPIDGATLAAAVERIRPVVESLREGPEATRPSFFDATTAVALLLFAEAGVDRVLLEVGLGGRLDSTNAVTPDVCCITSIELEHTDKLGETEALIAGEKAGILKTGIPAIVGPLRDEAMSVVLTRASQVGTQLRTFGDDYRIGAGTEPDEALRLDAVDGFRVSCGLATPGEAARTNAALAIACVRALGAHPDEAVVRACRTGLAGCALPGRVERLAADPLVIVDSSHTARSAADLAKTLEALAPGGFDLVLSVSGDKELENVLAPLLEAPGRGRVVTTRAEPARSLPADWLAKRIDELAERRGLGWGAVEPLPIEDPEEAVRVARAQLEPGRMLVATGSVYLAGIARRVLGGVPAQGDAPRR
ncbi:MAG: Mur ligase family protein [bacterium]|nr:Mur ligase family protein [bacterium]